jgi:hypothetical protein
MLLQRVREEVLSYVARAYIKEWVGAGVLRVQVCGLWVGALFI